MELVTETDTALTLAADERGMNGAGSDNVRGI
jgi:hypothetical protein